MAVQLVCDRGLRAQPGAGPGHDLRGGSCPRSGQACRHHLGAGRRRWVFLSHRRRGAWCRGVAAEQYRRRTPSCGSSAPRISFTWGSAFCAAPGGAAAPTTLANDSDSHFPARRDHERAQPEGRALLPRVSPAVRRPGARPCGTADSRIGRVLRHTGTSVNILVACAAARGAAGARIGQQPQMD